jgi:hypothetical protein
VSAALAYFLVNTSLPSTKVRKTVPYVGVGIDIICLVMLRTGSEEEGRTNGEEDQFHESGGLDHEYRKVCSAKVKADKSCIETERLYCTRLT